MRRSTRDDAEFTEFVAARSDQLYRSAYLLTTSSHAAEDLLQTTLTKVYLAWRRMRTVDDPVGYAHGILIKSFLSERRLKRSGELPVAETPEAAGTATDPVERMALMAVLAELSPLDRAVVVLRYWNDQSVAATAADLGLTEAAVKNRSLRGLRQLRALLGTDAPDPAAPGPTSPTSPRPVA